MIDFNISLGATEIASIVMILVAIFAGGIASGRRIEKRRQSKS